MNETGRWRWESAREVEFVRRALILIGLGVLIVLAWKLSDVLLLAFGAILVAVILHAFADVLVEYLYVPKRWGLTTATLIIFIGAAVLMVLFGAHIRAQLANVTERLPFAIDNFTKELGLGEVTSQLPQMLGMGPGGGFISRIAGIGGIILGGLADFLLVVIAGLYIAAAPNLYRSGLVKLFPASQRERVKESLDAVARALKLWLVSQLLSMTCVGVVTGLALWFIDLPSPFALGLIAGIVDFIPFVGPIIGALPAILIASTMSATTVLWTIIAFVVIQQIEGNLIFPMIERRVVAVPPALALFAIVAAGVLFGIPGVIFGFPLAVVAFVLVKKLYVRETLGEPTPVPGEKGSPGVT
jgi:predicted PurR-regulated permease PerM